MEWLKFDLVEDFFVTCIPIPRNYYSLTLDGDCEEAPTWLVMLEAPRAKDQPCDLSCAVAGTEELGSLANPICIANALGLKGREREHYARLWLEYAAPCFDDLAAGAQKVGC